MSGKKGIISDERMAFFLKAAQFSILFALIFLILLVVVAYGISASPMWQDREAAGGYIDLAVDADVSGKNVYTLLGEWEFYPNELYSYQDFEEGNVGRPTYVSFPHYWRDEREQVIGQTGYATYRVRARIPAEITDLGLYVRYQYSAFDVYIDDVEVCGSGIVDKDVSKYRPVYAPSAGYRLDMKRNGNEIDIIVHIQNETHYSGGFSKPIYIGNATSMRGLNTLLLFLNGFVSGGLFMMALSFLLVYLNAREKKEYIDYTVVTSLALFISLTTGGEALLYALVESVPWVDSCILLRLEYCCLLLGGFFANYSYINSGIKSNRLKMLIHILLIAVVVAECTMPTLYLTSIAPINAIAAASFFLMPFVSGVRTLIKKWSFEQVLEVISDIVLFVGLTLFLINAYPWGSVDLFSYSMLVHCALKMIIFLRKYGKVEHKLQQLTETVDQRIEERTANFKAATERAEQMTMARNDFIATISKELRTTVSAVVGMSELIDTAALDANQQRYVADIQKTSRGLVGTLDDIFDIANIEAGKLELVPNHFSFELMYDDLCGTARAMAEEKRILFTSELDKSIAEVVYGDERRYRQIIWNILDNALKYTKAGQIFFRVELIDREGVQLLRFIVEDTGVGIRAEDIPRIFDEFEQIDSGQNEQFGFDNSDKHKIAANGLGLAVSKRLVEKLHGEIHCASVYGAGSTFTVILPYAKGNPRKIARMDENKIVIALEGTRVLVVDDSVENTTVARGYFARHNIQPDVAHSQAEAVEMVHLTRYDLILMGYKLTDTDGIRATEAIRQLGEDGDLWLLNVPIIAFVANTVSGLRERMLDSGMNDYLSKPIVPAHLNLILAKWLSAEKFVHEKVSNKDTNHILDSHLAILASLELVDGLNLHEALESLEYNEAVYFDILRQFCREVDRIAEEIEVSIMNRNWRLYRMKLSSTKSSLVGIGAVALAEEVEQLLGVRDNLEYDENFDKVLASSEKLVENMQKLRDQLLDSKIFKLA